MTDTTSLLALVVEEVTDEYLFHILAAALLNSAKEGEVREPNDIIDHRRKPSSSSPPERRERGYRRISKLEAFASKITISILLCNKELIRKTFTVSSSIVSS